MQKGAKEKKIFGRIENVRAESHVELAIIRRIDIFIYGFTAAFISLLIILLFFVA